MMPRFERIKLGARSQWSKMRFGPKEHHPGSLHRIGNHAGRGRAGRVGFGVEIEPLCCDVALRRSRALSDLEAVLEPTGKRFDEVAQMRAEEAGLAPS